MDSTTVTPPAYDLRLVHELAGVLLHEQPQIADEEVYAQLRASWPQLGSEVAAAVLLSPSGTTRVPGWLGFSVFLMLSTCGHGASPNGASPNSAASQSIDYF